MKRGCKLDPNKLHLKFEGSTIMLSPKNAKTTYIFQFGPILAILTQLGPKTIGFLWRPNTNLCVNLMIFRQIRHPISRRQECDGRKEGRTDGRTYQREGLRG